MKIQAIVVLTEKLECGDCADVLVKVDDPALLSANDGVVDPAKLKTFITAKIDSWTIVASKDGCRYYQYTISFDDAQLQTPAAGLDECNIVQICCANCLKDYVDEQFIDEATVASLVDNGDNSFTFDDGLGILTTVNFAHTLAESNPGELTLTRPDATTDVVNLQTLVNLPLLGTGIPGDPLDVLLSADAGNVIVLGADNGLYVPTPPAGAETLTTLVDNGDNSFTYTSENATITTVPFGHTLSEPVTDTIRLTRPDGSFDDVSVTGVVTTLVDNGDVSFTYTSEDTTVTTFDAAHVLSSPGTGQLLLTRPDLTTDALDITVNANLPLQGDGSPGSPLDVLISADAGNIITLGADSGLYAVASPGDIEIVRGIRESTVAGTTISGLYVLSMPDNVDTSLFFHMTVPQDWDTSQNPTAWIRGWGNAAADGDYRFRIGYESIAIGENVTLGNDENFTFEEPGQGNVIMMETTPQSFNAANINPGDTLRVEVERVGTHPQDDQSGDFDLLDLHVNFPRVDFGVTT